MGIIVWGLTVNHELAAFLVQGGRAVATWTDSPGNGALPASAAQYERDHPGTPVVKGTPEDLDRIRTA